MDQFLYYVEKSTTAPFETKGAALGCAVSRNREHFLIIGTIWLYLRVEP